MSCLAFAIAACSALYPPILPVESALTSSFVPALEFHNLIYSALSNLPSFKSLLISSISCKLDSFNASTTEITSLLACGTSPI